MRQSCAVLAALFLTACAGPNGARLDAAEPLLADYLDAAGAVDMLDSDVQLAFDGASLEEWRTRYAASETALSAAIAQIDEAALPAADRRRLASMRSALALRAGEAEGEPQCSDVATASLTGPALRAALYVCYDERAEAIAYGGARVGRLGALALLDTLPVSGERRAVFQAMSALTTAVHAGEVDSPYRRIMRLENARMRANVDAALQTLGLDAAEGEAWLEGALEAWSRRLPYERAEAWDFRYLMRGGAAAESPACSGRDEQIAANARFYRDLGADLGALGVIIDTQSGAPVAYADLARVGREVDGEWRPAVPWTTLAMDAGGPDAAALLVHETGHTTHYAAMRARPSLIFPDDISLLLEATADVTAWSVWEPMWQEKYADCAYPAAASLRIKLAPVMMDMAWGLFELRMARAPESDPNVVWGNITERYFHVTRHDDVAWWAVRGQLVEEPGYMVNYALGAFVTVDLRARVRDEIGNFDAGNSGWYAYMTRNLYMLGGERPPRELLRGFLGRDVTPNAFVAELERLSGSAP